MPNSPSAKKRLRQDAKRTALNKSKKTRLRTQIKKFEKAVAAKDATQAQAEYRLVASLLDKTAKHKIIKDGNAARRKSRLAKKLNALLAPPAASAS